MNDTTPDVQHEGTETLGNGPRTKPAPAPQAVIACDYPDHRIWAGRILRHAPGPAATARTLYELLLTYPKKDRHRAPAADLIISHPSGWEYLGPDPAAEPARRAKRGQLGRCLCHHPDGTPTQAVIDEALSAMTRTEWRRAANPFTAPADGAPRLIKPADAKADPRIAYVFYLQGQALRILARDGGTGDFTEAGAIRALPGVDFDALGPELDANAAAIAARTKTDVHSERLAAHLVVTAACLAEIPAQHDLVLHLLTNAMRHQLESRPSARDAESALARAAGIPSGELSTFLARASRGEQLRILQLAAHQLAPRLHPAPPIDLGTTAERQHPAAPAPAIDTAPDPGSTHE
jgi:hypothetical protein